MRIWANKNEFNLSQMVLEEKKKKKKIKRKEAFNLKKKKRVWGWK
jgi:hypothetical protein